MSRGDDGLVVRLLGPPEPELTGEECFAELDRYAELRLRSGC